MRHGQLQLGLKNFENALNAGNRTPDIMQPGKQPVSTAQMGAAVVKELEKLAA